MYGNVKRSNEYTRLLLDFIQREYGIEAIGIIPAKRSYYGETWQLDTAYASYFIKLVYSAAHKIIYERSFPVIQHICDCGIDFISRIKKTRGGCLSAQFDGAVLGIFDWIDGETRQDETTKSPEYQMLAKIYNVPTNGLILPSEDFSLESVNIFYGQWKSLPSNSQIREVFKRYGAKIEHCAERLQVFSERCKNDLLPLFITHGDAGANVMIHNGQYRIVDWDNPILAPPERDAWFCQQWDWAMDAFNKALRQEGINYTLRPERLAYCCYDMFFRYLTWHMETYYEIGGNLAEDLPDYFNGWIDETIKYADNIY